METKHELYLKSFMPNAATARLIVIASNTAGPKPITNRNIPIIDGKTPITNEIGAVFPVLR